MKPIEIVAISLAFLAIWLTVLSVRVSQLRLRHRVSFGDGGHRDLLVAMRAHGNTLEQTALYGPLALGCAALPAASAEGLLVCALMFGVARVLHAAGIFGRQLSLRQVSHIATVVVQLSLVGLMGRALWSMP
jgi:uncharacterized membrane protein YecN with MAPEG domain